MVLLLNNQFKKMAKKKENDIKEKIRFWDEMRDETVQAILAIFSILITVISLLASFGKAGVVGEFGFKIFTKLFGVGYFLIPIVFALLSISFLQGLKKKFQLSKAIGAILFFISGLGIIYLLPQHAGGIIGKWITYPFISLIDVLATAILLSAIFIISIMMMFNIYFTLEHLLFWRLWRKEKKDETDVPAIDTQKTADNKIEKLAESAGIDSVKAKAKPQADKKNAPISDEDYDFSFNPSIPLSKPFNPPPLSLLEKDRGKPETGDIKASANIIKRTLQTFGITVEMDEISIGPSVTRYALKPAEGVKLSRIVALNSDLSLALAAHPIRIEAPIPGKSLVGIEVPNTAKTTVGLASLLSSTDYQNSDKPLLMSLGKDITGRAHFSNLAKAPHALIAGATGSGKSVTIHAIITSLLYRNSPENLKFIMIDPKRVELTLYNKIPHLFTPVITEPKKAIIALKWAAQEMSRRYDVLEQNAARDIDSYHKNILIPATEKAKKDKTSPVPETMPYIVIVIDELADIMQTYPRELESAIVRLAQMSRAVGIHLIISTQRPSVNVITGLIKANIPTRIALQVASQIDSRTILDQQGAEKLLGAGDMLYLGGDMSKPVRLQSAYISESEVKSVVKFIADEYRDEIMDQINLTPNQAEPASDAVFNSMNTMMEEDSIEDEDEYLEDAKNIVLTMNKASTSFLQRKLGIGYSRAAKLIDQLEQKGIVGPQHGTKPREIYGASTANSTNPPPSPSDNQI